MSRIGKRLIDIPSGVTVKVEGSIVTVKGPQGELKRSFAEQKMVQPEMKDGKLQVTRKDDSTDARREQGLVYALVRNLLQGVAKGFERDLEINGVGYRANLKGKNLELSLGFSHPVVFAIPAGITIKADGQTKLKISGASRELVGETAAKIRGFRPPEPYKGKGIKYADEVIRRKAGKSAAGAK